MCCFQLSSTEFHPVDLISRRSGRTVRKLVHRPTGTFFALKSVPIDADQSFLETHLSHETELLLEFDHPNVVKCHDVVVDPIHSEYNILLEFMTGGSLAGRHIPDCCHLSGIARQILNGIAYLHSRGIPHWDIKPSNLLTDGSGHVAKIADFGRSRYLATIRDRTEFIQTVSYMSPERIGGELNGVVGGFPGDIWGFGMSVLEAYLGRYPIGGGGVPAREWECSSLMRAICGVAPPRAPPGAPVELCHFISCCLRREPERRWSAAELLLHPFIVQRGGNTITVGPDIPTSVP